MFITIVGTRYAGKTAVEEYLVKEKRFTGVRISPQSDSASSSADLYEEFVPYDDDTVTAKRYQGASRYRPVSFLTMNSPVSSSFPVNSPQQRNESLCFASSSELLDYVTRNWRNNLVTVDLNTEELLQPFLTRPFVLVVYVDAPLLVRFQRCGQSEFRTASLHDFIQEHDSIFYSNATQGVSSEGQLRGLSYHAHLSVINMFDSKTDLFAHLNELDLLNAERLRPSWDTYFMRLASLASLRSNCMKRRVGAILVRNKRVLATGYNGTPRGLMNCNEGGCRRCNNASEVSDECVCLHAEENALLEAGRERVGDGAVLYCNTCPCLKCTIKIIQTGVKEVVYNLSYKVDDDSAALFKEAGVMIRRHAPPPEH